MQIGVQLQDNGDEQSVINERNDRLQIGIELQDDRNGQSVNNERNGELQTNIIEKTEHSNEATEAWKRLFSRSPAVSKTKQQSMIGDGFISKVNSGPSSTSSNKVLQQRKRSRANANGDAWVDINSSLIEHNVTKKIVNYLADATENISKRRAVVFFDANCQDKIWKKHHISTFISVFTIEFKKK